MILFSGIISGSEAAFFSLSKNDRKNQKIKKLIDNPNELLSTILISNNFINICIIVLSSYFINNNINISDNTLVKFFFEVLLITFILLIFGELIPKVIANKNSKKFVEKFYKLFLFLTTMLKPVNSILLKINFFSKMKINKLNKINKEEIIKAIDLTYDEEKTNKQNEIINSIINFNIKKVKDVMTPRINVTCINYEDETEEIINKIIKTGFSRIPVIDNDFDNIKGMLYVKDLINLNQDDWKSVIRKPFFVPEQKNINNLLKEFQKLKIHFAIVVNEFGGSEGIITLEDIIEEIIGEINDEFDYDKKNFYILNKNKFIADSNISLIDLSKKINVKINEENTENLAGLIIKINGDIPKKGDKIIYKNLEFTIESSDKRKIKFVKITKNEK
ncbi:MAG: hypothetical protein CMP58_02265 [Flavobacteriales bacterium]|nr:hypothetical protein [Flavobacteriales bacterium]